MPVLLMRRVGQPHVLDERSNSPGFSAMSKGIAFYLMNPNIEDQNDLEAIARNSNNPQAETYGSELRLG
jgi:hypothetical protein